jgi:hypothetical protein
MFAVCPVTFDIDNSLGSFSDIDISYVEVNYVDSNNTAGADGDLACSVFVRNEDGSFVSTALKFACSGTPGGCSSSTTGTSFGNLTFSITDFTPDIFQISAVGVHCQMPATFGGLASWIKNYQAVFNYR